MTIDLGARFKGIRLSRLRKAWKAFRQDLKPGRGLMAGAVACGLGATLMQILRPWPIKIVFDAILPTQKSLPVDPRLESLAAGLGDGLVLAVCVSLLVISLFWGLLNYGQTYLTARAGQSLVYSLRYKAFAHLQRLSLRFHQGQQRGDLLMRLTGDINLLRDMLVNALLTAVSSTLLLATMLTVLLVMDWQLALVVVTLLPLLALTTFRFSFRIREAARRQRKSEGKIAAAIAEMLAGVRAIQANGREGLQERRFHRSNRQNLKAGLKATRLEASMSRAVELLLAAGTAAVFWFGVRRVLAGHLTPGDLLVFVSYVHASFRPLRRLSRVAGRVAKAQASSERLTALLHSEPEAKEAPDARKAKRIEGAIEISRLSVTFPGNRKALNRVSLHIEPRSFVGLVGPSGAGKSTLLMALLRLYDLERGRIRLDGRDFSRYRLQSLRDQFAILMQSPFLFGTTIRDNITFGLPGASEIEVVRAAKLAGALDFVRELPKGFDTPVAEAGDSLSAGQRQRIAIARAFLRQAPILLLDEPTTGLDAATEDQLMAVLRRLMEGRTTIMVAHSLACVREADRILVLKRGRLIEDGTHEELLALGGWYARTWRTQSRKMKQRPVVAPVPSRSTS